MRLGTYLSSLTKPELIEVLDKLNLNDEDLQVVDMIRNRKSYIEIADKCCISVSTIDRIVKDIKVKLERL